MLNLIKAFIIRNFEIERAYRLNFLVKTVSAVFQLAVFFFIAKFIGKPDYFSFVFAGLLFSRFFHFWLNVFTENIRQEQFWGTAETIFLSPNGPAAAVSASAFASFLSLVLELAFFLAAGILIFGAGFNGSAVWLFPLALLNGAAFAGIGLMSGSFIMYFKKGDPVNWFIGSSFDLLSGVYFPLAVLPDVLKKAAILLPTTSALGLWRKVLLEGSAPGAREILFQAVWAATLLAAGVALFRLSYRLTRRKGDLGAY